MQGCRGGTELPAWALGGMHAGGWVRDWLMCGWYRQHARLQVMTENMLSKPVEMHGL